VPVIVILVAIALIWQYLKLHPETWYYIHLGEKPFVALVYLAAIIFFGYIGWRVIEFLYLFITWPFRWLFRRPPRELPVVLPSGQWSFNERFEYATKEVREILQKMKDYAEGYRTVTDDMWSAMREWGLDLYLMFLRKDGYLADAYNYICIILGRHIDRLPETLPLGSYLRVPITDIIEREPDNAPYNVPYKKLYDVLVPYTISQELRYEGVWAPARPGSGKTNLLHCMLEENMPEVAAGKASVFICDSKSNDPNSLIDVWPSIDFEHEWGIKNVYYFQASDKLAINVFDLGDIDQIVPLFEYMLSELTGHDISGPQRNLLTNCLHVIKASDAPSIPALRDLLANGAEKHLQAIYRTRDHIKEFFTKSLPETDGRRTQNVTPFESAHHRPTRTAVLERLHALLSFSDKLYDTLVSTKTEIDLRKLIDQGSVIIVNAKLSDLGSKGSELWQRWWTMMLLEAGRHRYSQSPLYIYFDEGHRGIARDTKVSEILEEMRSACFAVTIAHQGDWQIQDPSVLRSLQGLSAITLRATGERGVFT
jgi:hypothetical protein